MMLDKKVKDMGLQMVGFALLAYIISVQFSFSTVMHYVFLVAFWAVFLTMYLNIVSLSAAAINVSNRRPISLWPAVATS